MPEARAAVLTINIIKVLYKVKRLSFGISAAPELFQRKTNTALAEGKSNYLDNIIVSGESREQHVVCLDHVLFRLENVGLRLQKEKYNFAVREANFLQHRIDATGRPITDEKVQPILNAPELREDKN